jgi:hypothetical protein
MERVDLKFETLNPKSETNSNARNSKLENGEGLGNLVRISDLFRMGPCRILCPIFVFRAFR